MSQDFALAVLTMSKAHHRMKALTEQVALLLRVLSLSPMAEGSFIAEGFSWLKALCG